MTTATLATRPQVTPEQSSVNFRDPAGLAYRMIRSGDRAAWGALLREGLRHLAVPIDHILRKREERALSRAQPSHLPTVLVVGAPRSGTTLVYQVLTRFLHVSYLNNLTALFPSAPLSAHQCFSHWLPSRGTEFHSYYGQTPKLADPNDGFHLWDQWLGTNRSQTPEQFSETDITQIRQFFDAWHTTTQLPFLNKNNRNTSCIRLLKDALRAPVFVIVRRDPFYVAQSLILARRKIQGTTQAGWGLLHQEADPNGDPLAYVDAVCNQVVAIERLMHDELADVAASQCVHINYEEFCSEPESALHDIAHSVCGVTVRDDVHLLQSSSFEAKRSLQLTQKEAQRVELRLSEFF